MTQLGSSSRLSGKRKRNTYDFGVRHLALATALLGFGVTVSTAQSYDDASPMRPNGGLAVNQIMGFNALVWSYDRFLKDEPWARVSPRSWKHNIWTPPVLDHNLLTSNQLLHPYHGALYFNSARSNNFGFWGAAAMTVVGSVMWEYLAETYEASPNDLITTPLGGIALGEASYRMASALRQADAPKWLRTVGSTMLDPAGGLTHLLHSSRASRGPRLPIQLGARLRVGSTVGGQPNWFADFGIEYGSLLSEAVERPFDVFTFNIRLRGGAGHPVDRLESVGAIRSFNDPRGSSGFGLFQNMDYVRSDAVEFGGQSFGLGWVGVGMVGSQIEGRGFVQLGGLVLGSTPARIVGADRRQNDYGPGIVAKIEGSVYAAGNRLFWAELDAFLLQGIAGTNGRHLILSSRVGIQIPVTRNLGLGVLSDLSSRFSFDDLPRDEGKLSSRVHAFVSIAI